MFISEIGKINRLSDVQTNKKCFELRHWQKLIADVPYELNVFYYNPVY